MTNLKKYTNADFYKNGVFQQEIAIEAMKEMFVHYNIPFTGFMAENMWVTDFGLGDFENCVIQKVGDILRLKEMETFHFMMAGPEGAVVCEWANYHDNAGLRFTHPTATL